MTAEKIISVTSWHLPKKVNFRLCVQLLFSLNSVHKFEPSDSNSNINDNDNDNDNSSILFSAISL